MKFKYIIMMLGLTMLVMGCNVKVDLNDYSNVEILSKLTTYCGAYNGTVNVINNTVDLLYANCIVGDYTTEVYKNGRGYIERHKP